MRLWEIRVVNERSHKLTRQELYEAVWADPMRRVAQRHGVSDAAHDVQSNADREFPDPGRFFRYIPLRKDDHQCRLFPS